MKALEIKKINPTNIENYASSIVELLNLAFVNAKFEDKNFIHKHLNSPYGPSICYIAKMSNTLVGVRLFSRGELPNGTQFLQAVDTSTHPDFQGKGVFKKLIEISSNDPEVKESLLINFPNNKSFPQYLKYGWKLYHQAKLVFGIIKKPKFFYFKTNASHTFDKTQGEFISWRMDIGSEKKEIISEKLNGFGIVSQTIIKNKKFIRIHGVYGIIDTYKFIEMAYSIYPDSLGVVAFDIDHDCCIIIKNTHMATISISSNFRIAVKGSFDKIDKICSLNSDVY